MDLRRRPLSSHKLHHFDPHKPPSDSPAYSFSPLYLTKALFFSLFFSVSYFLLHCWRDKIRTSTPLHIVTLSEIAAILSFLASVVYLLGFFGIGFLMTTSIWMMTLLSFQRTIAAILALALPPYLIAPSPLLPSTTPPDLRCACSSQKLR